MQNGAFDPETLEVNPLAQATEVLKTHLMPAQEQYPFRWSRAGADEASGMDLNQTWLLAAAWCQIDPKVAEEIVQSALSCQREDGLLPARSSGATSQAIAWPLFAQSVRQVWLVTKNNAFAEYCLPRLERYLSRVLDYYDPRGTGFPRWKTAEEALDPAAFHPEVAPVDLISLLTSEIEAYEQLAQAVPSARVHRSIFAVEQQQFLNHLINIFWDRSALVFKDRYATGAAVEQRAPTHLLPWLCESLPSIYRREGLAAAFAAQAEGVTPPTSLIFLLLESCHRAHMGRDLEALRGRFRKDLDEAVTPSPDSAALRLVLEKMPSLEQPTLAGSSSLALKLDHHRSYFIVGLALLGGLLALVLFFSVIAKRQPPLQSMEAMIALARQHYVQGRYDEAILAYNDLLDKSPNLAPLELGLANTYFRKGDFAEAERRYRQLLKAPASSPSGLMNLAATLYRQGQRREAYEMYRQFEETYGLRYPELGARARLAMQLLQNKDSSLSGASPAAIPPPLPEPTE